MTRAINTDPLVENELCIPRFTWTAPGNLYHTILTAIKISFIFSIDPPFTLVPMVNKKNR